MRVLHITHDYFPAVGGSEYLFQKIGEGLADRGHEVHLYTSTARALTDFLRSRSTDLQVGEEEIGGVRVRRFPYRRFTSGWPRRLLYGLALIWGQHRLPGYGRAKAFSLGPHLKGLERATKALCPDLIAATAAPFQNLFAAARAGRRGGFPVALMPCLHPSDRWHADNPAVLSLLESVPAVLTLTEAERLHLQSLGVASQALFHLGGGVDPEAPARARQGLRRQFEIGESEKIVLFFGRKEEGKGIASVVEAAASLLEEGLPIRLVIAGSPTPYSSGPLAAQLEALPEPIRNRIIVRDDVDEAEKWGWLQEACLLALPSRMDSLGLVYLEAWACGTPVVAGLTGPQSCLIDHEETGLLVTLGNQEELTTSLRHLVQDEDLARRLGKRGRATVLDKHTWRHVVDRAELIYQTVARLDEDHEEGTHQRRRRHPQPSG